LNQSFHVHCFFLAMEWLTRFVLAFSLAIVGCTNGSRNLSAEKVELCNAIVGLDSRHGIGNCALLASRFGSLEELQGVIQLDYSTKDTSFEVIGPTEVSVCTNCLGTTLKSTLRSGVSQDDITNAKNGTFLDRVALIYNVPYAISNRLDLERVYTLARRLPMLYAEGDPSFYDIAAASVSNISTLELAFKLPRDSSEKGYLNTFNHITAQAFVTSIFSEDLADYIADLHERKNMPELTTGRFSTFQLLDSISNPVDNYVDMINNEIGQEYGKYLKMKYGIHRNTVWTPSLLSAYLNDLQGFYSWAFGIGFNPYTDKDELVISFSSKMNTVLLGSLDSNGRFIRTNL
jgi:hypothetical protein